MFKKYKAQNYDICPQGRSLSGFELDVTETADGRLVILHDPNLNRVMGQDINIWEISSEELDLIRRSGDSDHIAAPSLDEVLKLCRE